MIPFKQYFEMFNEADFPPGSGPLPLRPARKELYKTLDDLRRTTNKGTHNSELGRMLNKMDNKKFDKMENRWRATDRERVLSKQDMNNRLDRITASAKNRAKMAREERKLRDLQRTRNASTSAPKGGPGRPVGIDINTGKTKAHQAKIDAGPYDINTGKTKAHQAKIDAGPYDINTGKTLRSPSLQTSPVKALKSVGKKILKKIPLVGTALGLATAHNKLDAASAIDPSPISTGLETATAAADAVTNLNKFRMGALSGPAMLRDVRARTTPEHARYKKFFK